MKTLNNVTGADILNSYIQLHGEQFSEVDKENFTKAFQKWIDNVRLCLGKRIPCDLSLNKRNYLGKKTRALLHAINKQEPKTLGILFLDFWNTIPENY